MDTRMNNKVIIYGLFDPRNGNCFYIGKTINGLQSRLQNHITNTYGNIEKGYIINSILADGLRPVISDLLIIDDYNISQLDANYWEYVEMYFINYTRNVLGEPLTNVAKGGDGEHKNVTVNPIKQYNLNGKYIRTWNSTADAARHIAGNEIKRFESVRKAIYSCINSNKRKHTAYEIGRAHV